MRALSPARAARILTYRDIIIASTYRADPARFRAGLAWYASERDYLIAACANHPDTLLLAAILSPMASWRDVRRMLPAWIASMGETPMPGFGANIRKARRVLHKLPCDSLGPKVSGFLSSLESGGHTYDVAIDRHAWSMLESRPVGSQPFKSITLARYRDARDAFGQASDYFGDKFGAKVWPAQLQAGLWCSADGMGPLGRERGA